MSDYKHNVVFAYIRNRTEEAAANQLTQALVAGEVRYDVDAGAFVYPETYLATKGSTRPLTHYAMNGGKIACSTDFTAG
jgi:hypothetical protein